MIFMVAIDQHNQGPEKLLVPIIRLPRKHTCILRVGQFRTRTGGLLFSKVHGLGYNSDRPLLFSDPDL